MGYIEDVRKASLAGMPWEKLSGKSILITGSTGLIGSCIVEVLMAHPNLDYDVFASGRNIKRAKDLFAHFWNNKHFHFLQFDVCADYEFDYQFNFIISAASGANPVLYSTDPVGVMRTTFYGTDNLLRYGAAHSLERFLFVSSGDVYGEGNKELISEDYCGYINSLNLRSCYGLAKRAAESLCKSYESQYGLQVVVARPCHTYGPHFIDSDTRAYAQFIRKGVAGENIVMKSAGSQVRSWCYVVDAAKGILCALLCGDTGAAYNIADPNSIRSIREFAETLAKVCSVDLIMDVPSEIEKKGFSVITNSMFDTRRLKELGWNVEGTLNEKLLSTVTEVKNNTSKNG